MATQRWNELSNGKKATVIGVAAADAALRAWAGKDLASRPSERVRGPKWVWGVGLSLVSSAGVLPAVYLLFGRRN